MKQQTASVMPFHLFQQNGFNYLINIEKMAACSVHEQKAEILKKAILEPEMALTPEIYEGLDSLGLVHDNQKGAPKKSRADQPIVSMALFVTQACNLRCVYCYEEKPGGSIDEQTACLAVDWLLGQSGNEKKIYISFFGGEPFLNFPVIKKVALYAEEKAAAKNKTVSFSVTTNATLLNEDIIQFLHEHHVSVLVSMDGPKDIQDAQRPFCDGRGSYDTILPRVRRLLEVMPETRVHAVLLDDSKAETMKSGLKDLGFPEVTLLPASASLFETDGKSREGKQPRRLDSLLRDMENEAALWLVHIKNKDASALKELRSSAQLTQAMLALLHNKKIRYACGAGVKFVAVSTTGGVYLCHRFAGLDAYKLGNIFEDVFERGDYIESPLTRVPACAACYARYYCAGGCKHDNAGACGSAFSPSPDMCLLKKRELELAAAVISQLDEGARLFLTKSGIFPQKPCPLDF